MIMLDFNKEKFLELFSKKYNLLTILGPTATGKTSFAAKLAYYLDGEIISADSRQVYKGMDIGTGKDIEDYTVEGKTIPYHLVDIINAGEKYNLFRYQRDFFSVFEQIQKRKKTPILCGGSGLYLEAIIKNYELVEVPENKQLRQELEKYSLEELTEKLKTYKKLHNTTEIDTKKRAIRAIEIEIYKQEYNVQKPEFQHISSFNIGIKFDRQTVKKRITERLHRRLKNGMIDEVKNLLDKGISPDTLIYYGLEYKFITLYLTGQISYETMQEKLNIAIHQFSKRQMTWFRRMERQGVKILWLDGNLSFNRRLIEIFNFLERKN